MSKTFTCCELVKRIREHQEAPTTNGSKKDKYIANEFLGKASGKITNKRIKKGINSEPVGTSDTDHLFCEKCANGFREQEEKQTKLIRAEIEKEKSEGKYYGPRNPKTYEGTVMEDTIKKTREEYEEGKQKEQRSLNDQNSPPFDKSPQA